MPTECSADCLVLHLLKAAVWRRGSTAGRSRSDAGALLLGRADRAIGWSERFAACFRGSPPAALIEHEVSTLVGQRVFGIALGYEDLNDHDELRHDPVMAVLAGKLAARRSDCAPVAGKSTLNRLELSRPEPTRYHKISHDAGGDRGAARSICSWRRTQRPPQADHARPRRHRRSAARPPGRPLLPRLLRLLLLSAALRVLRPASAGGQAAALRTSMPRPARSRRSSGSSARSAPAGRRCASCCGPIPASPARA